MHHGIKEKNKYEEKEKENLQQPNVINIIMHGNKLMCRRRMFSVHCSAHSSSAPELLYLSALQLNACIRLESLSLGK